MSYKAFVRNPEREAGRTGRATRWGTFALGCVVGCVLGMTVTQVTGSFLPLSPRKDDSLVGKLTLLVRERGSQAEVVAGSIEEAQRSEAHQPVLVPVREKPSAVRVPAMLSAQAVDLPDISGLPSKEVFARCAPEVDSRTMAALAKRMSAGNVWSVGLVGGEVYAASTYSTAVRLIETWRREGRNFNVGLMQLNPSVLARFGLSAEEALEPCTNLYAAQSILAELWKKESARLPASPQLALMRTAENFMQMNFRGSDHSLDEAEDRLTPRETLVPTREEKREEKPTVPAAPAAAGMVF